MSFENKLAAAYKELEEKFIKKSNYSNWVLRSHRKLGLKIRPSYYRSFWQNLLSAGLFFGTTWGIWMWFMQWEEKGYSYTHALTISLLAGLFFGLCMAFNAKYTVKKYNLSNWNDL